MSDPLIDVNKVRVPNVIDDYKRKYVGIEIGFTVEFRETKPPIPKLQLTFQQ